MENLKSFIFFAMMAHVFNSPAIAEQSKQSAADSMLRNSDWSAAFNTSDGTFYVDPSSRTRISDGVYTINVRLPARMIAGPFAWRDLPVHMQVYTIEVRCKDFQYKQIGWLSRYSNRDRKNVIGSPKNHDLDAQSIFYLSACADEYLINHLKNLARQNVTSNALRNNPPSVQIPDILASPIIVSERYPAPISEVVAPSAPSSEVLQSDSVVDKSVADAKRKCADLGFVRGTPKFGQCVLKVSE
jgi:hypothetical protein